MDNSATQFLHWSATGAQGRSVNISLDHCLQLEEGIWSCAFPIKQFDQHEQFNWSATREVRLTVTEDVDVKMHELQWSGIVEIPTKFFVGLNIKSSESNLTKYDVLGVVDVVSMGSGQAAVVTLVADSAGWSLMRNGVQHEILGQGKAHFGLLEECGANSIRLWSTNKSALLDSAHQRGMSVMLGLYLRPERTGMNYNDVHAVEGQLAELKQEVLKYKDHPALLLWGIGNELDLKYTNTRVWDAVEELAKFIMTSTPITLRPRCLPESTRQGCTWLKTGVPTSMFWG